MTMMKMKPGSRIEPLETRIAPAVLVNGANLLDSSNSLTHTGETSLGGNSVTLVNVLAGKALVWFDASTHSITGISVSDGAKLDITGNVNGDIVANLLSNGKLTDSDNNAANGNDGGILLANNILEITTHPLGNQNGDVSAIITGGSIKNLNLSGVVSGVYAGDGVYRNDSLLANSGVVNITVGLDVNPVLSGIQTGFQLQQSNAVFLSGASISNASIQIGFQLQMFAGDATKAGGAGGGVTNVTLTSAYSNDGGVPSYSIEAGDGADGKIGGAGGSVKTVSETNASGLVQISAGNGGNGSAGAGGAGGSVSNVNGQSDSANYSLIAGKGGNGVSGGKGGGAKNNNFSSQNPGTDLLVSGDFTGDGKDDLIVVDTSTGQMVLEKNLGSGFSPVIQDSSSQSTYITTQGATASSAVTADVNGDGFLDLIVSYKNSNDVGVFLNDGTGIFTGSSFSVGGNALQVVSGNFSGDANVDLAIIVGTSAKASMVVAQGDGTGAFNLLSGKTALTFGAPSALHEMVAANGYDGLFVGFQNGDVQSLVATGQAVTPFSMVDDGLLATGAITSLDVDESSQSLLVFSADARSLQVYSYNGSGTLSLLAQQPDISSISGSLVEAHFLNDGTSPETVAVLSSAFTASQIDVFTYDGVSNAYTDSTTLKSSTSLKGFVQLQSPGSVGVAALGSSLTQFYYSENLGTLQSAQLPFSGKSVSVVGGDGGDATGTGAAGSGGTIQGINAQADMIILQAGDGGSSTTGKAGAGGSIVNNGSFSIAGQIFPANLIANTAFQATAGSGGVSTGGHGGAGGSASGLQVTVSSGDVTIASGDGGDGGTVGGTGGNLSKLVTTLNDGSINLNLGAGGDGGTAGGNAGALKGFTHTLSLDDDIEKEELSYAVNVIGASGGDAITGVGGAGSSLANIVLNVDPSNSDSNADSTLSINLTAGDGGNGTIGGAGGAVTNVQETTVQDELNDLGQVILNSAVMQVTGGTGGAG